MIRIPKRLFPILLASILATRLAAPVAAAEPGTTEGAEVGEAVIRPAAPPTALERARVARWRRAWSEEARAFGPAFAAAVRAIPGRDPDLEARCPALAQAILAIDRSRVLPVPDPVVDRHLRRGLQAATLAAVACLGRRPYAARGKLREARDALRRADRRLRRYRAR